MGLRSWWAASRASADAARRCLLIERDQTLIEQQVPELAGMGEFEAKAYVLQQIDAWRITCTPEQFAEFARRGRASIEACERDGETMPFWATLWVLRTYQKSLGLDVPYVAPPAENSN